MMITTEFLQENKHVVFVFGDNLSRKGKRGASMMRDEPNTYGFITKKFPSNYSSSFYGVDEYRGVYLREIRKLQTEIMKYPAKTYLISKLGSGLANKFNIFEEVIEKYMKRNLNGFHNVDFLW